MAVPANTRLTFNGVQVREDLSDIIYNISPMDTPFMSGAGRGSCSNTLFEWQKDELAAAAANQKLEGDDPASLAVVEPTKLVNYTQISEKAVQTSGTAEAVDWAGRKSAQAYQLAKRAKEIKRDMEKMMLGNDVLLPQVVQVRLERQPLLTHGLVTQRQVIQTSLMARLMPLLLTPEMVLR